MRTYDDTFLNVCSHIPPKLLVVGSPGNEDVVSGFDSGLNFTLHNLEDFGRAGSLAKSFIWSGGVGARGSYGWEGKGFLR